MDRDGTINKYVRLLGDKDEFELTDGIYFCPLHLHKGYEGEVPELKFDCECCKLKPGMLLKAARDFNIDLENSFMVGDGENDIKARCKTVLIGSGEYSQDFTVSSVLDFINSRII